MGKTRDVKSKTSQENGDNCIWTTIKRRKINKINLENIFKKSSKETNGQSPCFPSLKVKGDISQSMCWTSERGFCIKKWKKCQNNIFNSIAYYNCLHLTM